MFRADIVDLVIARAPLQQQLTQDNLENDIIDATQQQQQQQQLAVDSNTSNDEDTREGQSEKSDVAATAIAAAEGSAKSDMVVRDCCL